MRDKLPIFPPMHLNEKYIHFSESWGTTSCYKFYWTLFYFVLQITANLHCYCFSNTFFLLNCRWSFIQEFGWKSSRNICRESINEMKVSIIPWFFFVCVSFLSSFRALSYRGWKEALWKFQYHQEYFYGINLWCQM